MKKLSLSDLFTQQDIDRLVGDIVRNGQLTGIYTNKNTYVATKPIIGEGLFCIKEIEKEVEVLVKERLRGINRLDGIDIVDVVKAIKSARKEKSMIVDLWEAVDFNEQLEPRLEELLEHLNEGKQKGYKMNFNVQEKLKEIDKQINELLEDQTKEKDPDLAIVEQFFSELQRVRQEMIALGEVDELVLATKLLKVYEFYKSYIPLTHELMGYYYKKLSN